METVTDGDDDDEEDKSEEGESEHENEDGEGGGGQRTQLRQTRNFYMTTKSVKRTESRRTLPLLQCVKLGGIPTATKVSP